MKKLIIEINTTNDAFEENRGAELARIFRELADKVEAGTVPYRLRDVNGNRIGQIEIEK